MSGVIAMRENLTSECGISQYLPHFRSSLGWLLLMAGSSTWHLPKLLEDVLEVEVEATALLQSCLVVPVPWVLPTFLSCHSYCFSAGVNWLNMASE